MNEKTSHVFILGSPRSGTTILGEVLGSLPSVAHWYEPYYAWERHLSGLPDDVWSIDQLSADISLKIKKDYLCFARLSKKDILVDKTPTHAFNIPFIQRVFPDARWIHIIRDGRDVTLSIRREWEKRAAIVRQKDWAGFFRITRNMLARQPFWRFRLMAVLHELRTKASFNPSRYLNKTRWEGYPGWGPRFPGWKSYLEQHTTLEFNAMQWVTSVNAAMDDLRALPEENTLEVRYEDLIVNQDEVLSDILAFCGAIPSSSYLKELPRLKANNSQKWHNAFDASEIEMIKPILTAQLSKLGYLDKWPW
ncbi:MAG TPA: sulfotransferase [Desulfonatronum sp.]|nr:sulfotransferase [Desulfonatronum sp.]